MKRLILIGIVILLAAVGMYLFSKNQADHQKVSLSSSDPQNSIINGVFEGITPCERDTVCEMTIWRIVFNSDRYTLTASYGMSQPNTTGIRGGGTKVTMEGAWSITRGTEASPEANVIELATADPRMSIAFLHVNDHMIHLLDSDGTMMVGNAGWSYTLNKTNDAPGFSTLPSLPVGSPITGTFEGRTPCNDLLVAFTHTPPAECQRIKWRITFTPSRYRLQTTRGVTEGSWTIGGNIYTLKSDTGEQEISFLKLDENHLFFLNAEKNILVGDALLSYTLSRTSVQ